MKIPNGAYRTKAAALVAARRECERISKDEGEHLPTYVSALLYRTDYGWGFALYDSVVWHEIQDHGETDRVDGKGIPVHEAHMRLAVEVSPS